MQEIGNNANVDVETVLMQLRNTEKRNQELLNKNKNLLEEKEFLEEKNQGLSIQVTQLQTEVEKMAKNRHKEAETIAIDALRKVFTPGQIKMLMLSTRSHIKWSAEDITSAILLRSLSPKAYTVLYSSNYEPNPEELSLLNDLERITSEDMSCVEQNALIYIAGYVAHRFRHRYTNLGVPTKSVPNPSNDWLCLISRGNCMYPSESFLHAAQITDDEFIKFHGDVFSKEDKIFDKLTNIVCQKVNNNFPKEVIACLVRTRTYIRLRKINKEIVQNNNQKKKGKKCIN